MKKRSVKFCGNIYSAEGVKPDPDKIEAITAMRAPETKSFLGMVNTSNNFFQGYWNTPSCRGPLKRKGFTLCGRWSTQEAFNRIKSLLAEDMLLALYDRKKPVTLQCDYSDNGLGAALVQDGRPVRFASEGLVNNKEDYRNVGCCVLL